MVIRYRSVRNGTVGKDEGRDIDRLQKMQYDGMDGHKYFDDGQNTDYFTCLQFPISEISELRMEIIADIIPHRILQRTELDRTA